jgi:Tol biopolymer transport system component
MNDERTGLEHALQSLRPEPGILDRVYRRRQRKQRAQRIAAAAVALTLVAAGALGFVVVHGALGPPATRPASHKSALGPPVPVGRPSMHNGPIDAFGWLSGGVKRLGSPGRGSFVVKCASPCTEVDAAAWSPDGSRLAFSPSCGGGCGSAGDPYHGLRVADPSTGSDRLLVPGEGIGPIAWSPDGSRIAYVIQRGYVGPSGWSWDRVSTLAIVNADGTDPVVLLRLAGLGTPASMSWSPDGSRIVYADWNHDVSVVGLDGSGPSTLTRGSDVAWSPDGKTIVYLAGCVVRTISPDGRDDRNLVDLLHGKLLDRACPTPDTMRSSDLTWSPDGTKLAVTVDGGLFMLNADGTHGHLIVTRAYRGLGGDVAVTWQPVR